MRQRANIPKEAFLSSEGTTDSHKDKRAVNHGATAPREGRRASGAVQAVRQHTVSPTAAQSKGCG